MQCVGELIKAATYSSLVECMHIWWKKELQNLGLQHIQMLCFSFYEYGAKLL